MSKLYRSSIFFGLAPLIIGTCIFILWYFTKVEVLITIGMLTILGGLVSVLIAVICLTIYLYKESQRQIPAKMLLKRGLLCGGLIAVNFPVALVFAYMAMVLLTTYSLTIKNSGSSIISKITITAPGVNEIFEQVQPGDDIFQRLDFCADGVLLFSANQNKNDFGGVIEGYVTGSGGGEAVLVIKDNGEYEVLND